MIPYIKNIVYSFTVISMCYFLLIIYKKYSQYIFSKTNLITNLFEEKFKKNDKKNDKLNDKINMSDRVEILKDKFGVKSTERTLINLNFLINKPSHLVTNSTEKIDKLDTNIFLKNNLKNLLIGKNSQEITKSYVYNKLIYNLLFINSDDGTKKITNLETFYIFHRKMLNKTNYKYNILFKFYSDDEQYLYVYVNDNSLIKIKKYNEYDKICELIENNDNIFLIQSSDETKYYITYGDYTTSLVTNDEIKNTFFNNSNSNSNDKNFNILKKFTGVKIFFYTSTVVNI